MSSMFSRDPARVRGARIGMTVGAAAVPVGLSVVGVGWAVVDPEIVIGRSSDFYVATALWVLGLTAIGLVSGGLAGWLFGPRAVLVSGWSAPGLVIRVAVSATVLGAISLALPLSFLMAIDIAVHSSQPLVLTLIPVFALTTTAIGLLFFGWFVVLAALPASYVWWRLVLRGWQGARGMVEGGPVEPDPSAGFGDRLAGSGEIGRTFARFGFWTVLSVVGVMATLGASKPGLLLGVVLAGAYGLIRRDHIPAGGYVVLTAGLVFVAILWWNAVPPTFSTSVRSL